ncbi:hypothetical protein GCM10012290_17720 [Halolactibacillus alkaliphilus]|uniref:histidine kinase n=1 Tax=Halolactibacillus alkaliphilus TaxID=442899 RepID=A0A511X2F0_9BACI|nr:histidine kinase [Halolactibacillus alkaliphilus]GEN57127.1 hypothetical protein HAL01_15910 [Halolactibacillus alkaliphilus]GGN72088.1 hypothetical protein GCM10012290_17720 [Halolactibacillus alkaliphilus]SFO87934.1 Histidine kinase-, DNA gyrase B-, and HSP90-like ATPase [Halolactibacillus alkaliphilus]
MHKIKHKVALFMVVVIATLFIIWLSLTYFNRQTQANYNDILERYLILNEANTKSDQLMTTLSALLTETVNEDTEKLPQLEHEWEAIQQLETQLATLENNTNQNQLTNYLYLLDSLVESTDRAIRLYEQQDVEQAQRELHDAIRIQTYISDQTLQLLDQELKTYDSFYRGMIEQSRSINAFGFWLLIFLVLILILVTYLFQRQITYPIHQLTRAANGLSLGDLDREIVIDSKDELAFLGKTFNRMRENIKQLIHEINQKAKVEKELSESKLLLQQTQLRSLQSQINPHFLFNTLNTVSKKAYLEDAYETSDLLVSIADLLRYNLKQLDRAVTLHDELRVIRQYVHIQQTRFSERLVYHEEIDETLLVKELPALTLQPIIENAVIHAVEPYQKGGNITLRIFKQGNYTRVEISDDGPGMADETIEALLSGSLLPKEGHSTGIGFTNVIKRMTLFFNQDNLVYIDAYKGRGTKVSLLLPETEGDKQDEDHDCR